MAECCHIRAGAYIIPRAAVVFGEPGVGKTAQLSKPIIRVAPFAFASQEFQFVNNQFVSIEALRIASLTSSAEHIIHEFASEKREEGEEKLAKRSYSEEKSQRREATARSVRTLYS